MPQLNAYAYCCQCFDGWKLVFEQTQCVICGHILCDRCPRTDTSEVHTWSQAPIGISQLSARHSSIGRTSKVSIPSTQTVQGAQPGSNPEPSRDRPRKTRPHSLKSIFSSKTSREEPGVTGTAISAASDPTLKDSSKPGLVYPPQSYKVRGKIPPSITSPFQRLRILEDAEQQGIKTSPRPRADGILQASDNNAVSPSTDTTSSSLASASDSENENEGLDLTLAITKHMLLVKLMSRCYFLLKRHSRRTSTNPLVCAGGGGSRSSGGSPTRPEAINPVHSHREDCLSNTTRNNNKRSAGEEGEDEDQKQKKPRECSNPQDRGETRRYACHFFKNDPITFCQSKSCTGPGFTTVSRVKEHLFRCHIPKIQCLRCCGEFKTETELGAHQRSNDAPCAIEPDPRPQIMTAEKIKLLRSKKRQLNDPDEKEKWRKIYEILFPGQEVPCPYYEPPSMVLKTESSGTSRSPELQAFQAFVRRNLAGRLEIAVNSLIEERLPELSNALDLKDIVQSVLSDIMRIWKDHPSPAASQPDRGPEPVISGPSEEPPGTMDCLLDGDISGILFDEDFFNIFLQSHEDIDQHQNWAPPDNSSFGEAFVMVDESANDPTNLGDDIGPAEFCDKSRKHKGKDRQDDSQKYDQVDHM